MTLPVATLHSPALLIITQTDQSDYVVVRVIPQFYNDVWCLAAFFRSKMMPAECDIKVFNKDLMANDKYSNHGALSWRVGRVTIVITDHNNLEYSVSTKPLSRQQACWLEILQQIRFRDQLPSKCGGHHSRHTDAPLRRHTS